MSKYTDDWADGEDGYTEWIRPTPKGFKASCCDCGLVHKMDFRVAKGRAEFRIKRDNRATAMVRRWRKANQVEAA